MPYRISGKIQHYAWGGETFLPALLNIENTTDEPYAEYWLGAHPKAPSDIQIGTDESITLNHFIASAPSQYLSPETAKRFRRLPYLFKVLDVHKMLSIQVHPSKKEAEKGFAREDAAGIPLDAPDRNYKDDNHKPEIMAALSTFYLLHGFKEPEALIRQLEETTELNSLLPVFKEEGYKGLYSKVMNMDQSEVNQLLTPLLNRVRPLYEQQKLSKESPDFWAAKALSSGMTTIEKIDRGIFSIYFFNLLCLQAGEGIFQAAGLPHAYLEGQNIELMANSDNVLRGGLTPKHVDAKELLQHVHFEGIHPKIIRKTDHQQALTTFPASVPDFCLSQIQLKAGEKYRLESTSVEIMLCIKGQGNLTGTQAISLNKGEAALMVAGETAELEAKTDLLIYQASVPQ